MGKTLLGIVGGTIGIIGFVLCVISIFVPDDLQSLLIKVAVALIIFDIIVIGVCIRILHIKDSIADVKKIFGKKKQDSASSENDSNALLDAEKRGAEEKEHNQEISSRASYSSVASDYPEWFKYLNLVMIILFFLFLVCAVVLFIIKQHIAGAIVVGCGIADIILLCIINGIAENKGLSKSLRAKGADVLNPAFSRAQAPIQLVEASASDAQVILDMQKIAFAELLEKYGDYDTSPATETLSKVESRFQDPNTYHYFINADGNTVGVIRVVDPRAKEKKRLAQVFVLPEHRRKGYAHSSIRAVEKIHGSTGWELDTILQERSLLTFYMRLGYRVKRQTERINAKMILVVMEK